MQTSFGTMTDKKVETNHKAILGALQKVLA